MLPTLPLNPQKSNPGGSEAEVSVQCTRELSLAGERCLEVFPTIRGEIEGDQLILLDVAASEMQLGEISTGL